MAQVLQDKDFYRHTGGGITISGGELLTQPDFAEALMEACGEAGIGTVLDTSGYGPHETLLRLASHRSCDHILFDLKHIESEAHKKYTGVGNELILHNLEALASDPGIRPKLIIRMPLIGGVNDSEETIRKTGAFLTANSLTKVTLLPYHNLGVSKCRNIGGEPELFEPPADGRIGEIREYFETCGVTADVLGR
jgi:pyruvate formate lyase activating enzyme